MIAARRVDVSHRRNSGIIHKPACIRGFDGKPLATKVSTGQVKNPLEFFPPKTPEDIDKAKVELRDAYSKDFAEYVDKKVFGAAAKKK